MNTIAILPEEGRGQPTTFNAVIAGRTASGRTVGEALDALTAQLSAEESAATVIVQQFQPDTFFPDAQRDRLSALMARWRAARDAGDALPAAEQAELERLVDVEAQGAGERASHISLDLEMARLLGADYEEWAQLARLHAEMQGFSRLREITLRAFLVGICLFGALIALPLSGAGTAPVVVAVGRVLQIALAVTFLGAGLLFVWRVNEAHKRLRSLSERAEGTNHLGRFLDFIRAREASADAGEYGERKKAR